MPLEFLIRRPWQRGWKPKRPPGGPSMQTLPRRALLSKRLDLILARFHRNGWKLLKGNGPKAFHDFPALNSRRVSSLQPPVFGPGEADDGRIQKDQGGDQGRMGKGETVGLVDVEGREKAHGQGEGPKFRP